MDWHGIGDPDDFYPMDNLGSFLFSGSVSLITPAPSTQSGRVSFEMTGTWSVVLRWFDHIHLL